MAESNLFYVSELRNYIFWKCNSLDPKKKEKQWSKPDLSTDELPHQPKKYPNSLIVLLNKPDSVNNDLSVTDFAVKKRKWEDSVRLIAANECKKKSYCYNNEIKQITDYKKCFMYY